MKIQKVKSVLSTISKNQRLYVEYFLIAAVIANATTSVTLLYQNKKLHDFIRTVVTSESCASVPPNVY